MVYRELEDRSILLVGINGRVIGLDRETGAVRWDNGLEGGGIGKVFLHIIGDRVLASAHGGGLFCLRYATGETLWTKTTSSQGLSTIIVDRDVIFVGKGGEVDAFTLDGELLWSQPLKGRGMIGVSLALPGNVQQSDAV
jgi:outer membrane protein assembly factor BamB